MAFRKAIFEEVGYFDELLDVGAAGCSGAADTRRLHDRLQDGFEDGFHDGIED